MKENAMTERTWKRTCWTFLAVLVPFLVVVGLWEWFPGIDETATTALYWVAVPAALAGVWWHYRPRQG
jgi:hypothetical protein